MSPRSPGSCARRSTAVARARAPPGAAVVYLTVTFFVVIFLLSGIDVQLQLVWVDVVLHKIFPIMVVADWILDPPMTRLSVRDGLLWLAFPLAWTGVTLVRGAPTAGIRIRSSTRPTAATGQVAITAVADHGGFLVVSGSSRSATARPDRRPTAALAREAGRLLPPREQEAATAHGA